MEELPTNVSGVREGAAPPAPEQQPVEELENEPNVLLKPKRGAKPPSGIEKKQRKPVEITDEEREIRRARMKAVNAARIEKAKEMNAVKLEIEEKKAAEKLEKIQQKKQAVAAPKHESAQPAPPAPPAPQKKDKKTKKITIVNQSDTDSENSDNEIVIVNKMSKNKAKVVTSKAPAKPEVMCKFV